LATTGALLVFMTVARTAALDPATHRVFSSTANLVWPKPTPGKKLLPNAKPGTSRLMVVQG